MEWWGPAEAVDTGGSDATELNFLKMHFRPNAL